MTRNAAMCRISYHEQSTKGASIMSTTEGKFGGTSGKFGGTSGSPGTGRERFLDRTDFIEARIDHLEARISTLEASLDRFADKVAEKLDEIDQRLGILHDASNQIEAVKEAHRSQNGAGTTVAASASPQAASVTPKP